MKFGMGFRHSALFMTRKKYPKLDLSDVDLTLMKGHNVRDLTDGSDQLDVQNVEEALSAEAIANQLGENGVQMRAENNENINEFNPLSSNVDVSPDPNVKDLINISLDVQNDN